MDHATAIRAQCSLEPKLKNMYKDKRRRHSRPHAVPGNSRHARGTTSVPSCAETASLVDDLSPFMAASAAGNTRLHLGATLRSMNPRRLPPSVRPSAFRRSIPLLRGARCTHGWWQAMARRGPAALSIPQRAAARPSKSFVGRAGARGTTSPRRTLRGRSPSGPTPSSLSSTSTAWAHNAECYGPSQRPSAALPRRYTLLAHTASCAQPSGRATGAPRPRCCLGNSW